MKIKKIVILVAAFLIASPGDKFVGYSEESPDTKKLNSIINDCCSGYYKLRDELERNGIEVPKAFENLVVSFIEKHSLELITKKTSSEGLAWLISKVIFLRNDLVYALYDDGHMYGGELLIKFELKDGNMISAKTLWNSGLKHK